MTGSTVLEPLNTPKMAEPSGILKLLKEGTAEIHKRTEERVPVFLPTFDLPSYCLLFERFYGFWAPMEMSLSKLSELRNPELDFEGRIKSMFLAKDLQALGSDPSQVPWCPDLPATDTLLSGLGCLYVMEGSTLGARYIARRIDEHLDLSEGVSFFNAYGDSTGRRWTEFRAFVTAHVQAEDAREVLSSAQDTFQSLYRWLGPVSSDII